MPSCPTSKTGLPGGFFTQVLLITAICTVVTSLIVNTLTDQTQIVGMLRNTARSLVYSFCVTLPARYIFGRAKERGLLARLTALQALAGAGALLLTQVAGCLAAGLALSAVRVITLRDYWAEFRGSAPFCTVATFTISACMLLYERLCLRLESATVELRTRQMEEERARKLLAEARLSSLESRIHPHFLFNTLNSISALIPKDPKRAEEMVVKLASLLRFSLNASQTGLVPLGQELKIVRDYLDIERARFGARLRYEIEAPQSLENVGVPPLSLESLVENSIKHVVAARAEGGWIRVTASAHDGEIQLEVRDDGPGVEPDKIVPGHGLDNLSARLALLFGARAGLTFARDNGYAVARVGLPLSPAEAAKL